MPETLDLQFADGSRIHIEGSEGDGFAAERGLDVVERVTRPFDTALGTVRKIADSLNATLNAAANRPDSVTVSFGLNFTVETGELFSVLTKGNAGANLNITMEWKKA